MAYALPRGEQQYQARCASCHGPRGDGDPRLGIPNLRDHDWLYGTGQVGELEQIIRYGIRSYNPKTWNPASMPAYATPQPSAQERAIPPLSPANIRDVVEFLINLQGRHADAPGAARGAVIFSGAGGCYDCHGADAKGDQPLAPPITDPITLYGDGSRNLYLCRSPTSCRQCPAWMVASVRRKFANWPSSCTRFLILRDLEYGVAEFIHRRPLVKLQHRKQQTFIRLVGNRCHQRTDHGRIYTVYRSRHLHSFRPDG